MTTRNLNFMFEPSSVALIVDPRQQSRIGDMVVQNFLRAGFQGKGFVVEPGGRSIEGVSSCVAIEQLPEAPDLAILLTPPETIPDHISRLGALGTKAAVIFASWKKTQGIEHRLRLRTALLDAAGAYRMRLLGPGSLGIMTPRISFNAGFAHLQPLKGNLALVAQSGAVLTSILDWATCSDIGFSHLVSLGGMVDVDFGDMLDYLANDLNTQAILLYMEAITQAKKFMSAARLAARLKPVVVLKGGRYEGGSRSVILYGEEPVGSDAAYDAAFCRAGMLRVDDIRELFAAVESLARARAVSGDRLAIVGNSRGMGILSADALVRLGGRLAEPSDETIGRLRGILPAESVCGNPIDLKVDATPELYSEAVEVLLADRGIDAVLVFYCPNALESGTEIARSIIERMKKDNLKSKCNRLFTSWPAGGIAAEARRLFAENRIPAYDTTFDAVGGFMQLARHRRNQEMLMQTPSCIPNDFVADSGKARRIIDGALAEGREWLTDEEAKSLLAAYHIADLKPGQSGNAYYELHVGVVADGQFGPVILFGYGGEAGEALEDKALALPPLNMHLARELMARTRIFRLIEGRCQNPSADIDGIAFVLVRVSQLICDVPQVVELTINPLRVDDLGLSAAGARVRIARVPDAIKPRLVISPYPAELEQEVVLPDGQILLLRPIRPEDEPAYVRLFESLLPEDILMRFMSRMRSLPHSLAARLTQIDYDREMALVLVEKSRAGATELLGGVRFSADADNDRAEFAILLRRDMTGMGLGPMMLRRIIEAARKRGIRELFGEILSENQPMLKLCKAFGFSLKRMPDDFGVFTASLEL